MTTGETTEEPLNFALVGAAGFIAPRHLRAIRDTGNRLVAAVDPKDSVGVLDSFSFSTRFFTEFERFDRYLEKLRRGPDGGRVKWVTICSPNYLHDTHCRAALRIGASAICEKPLVINPWNLDALADLEREHGKKIYTVLQLRLHPDLVQLKARLEAEPARHHNVVLRYVTARGPWYDVSWKGQPDRAGGVATNIGIHFFDLVLWLFGKVRGCEVLRSEPRRIAGVLELERATVDWYLSVEASDLPFQVQPGKKSTMRSICVDGHEVEFSEGFADLHTRVYQETISGRGFGIEDARPSVELVHSIRTAPVTPRSFFLERRAVTQPAVGDEHG